MAGWEGLPGLQASGGPHYLLQPFPGLPLIHAYSLSPIHPQPAQTSPGTNPRSALTLFKAYKVIPETAMMPMPKSTAAGNTADPVASKFREYLAAVCIEEKWGRATSVNPGLHHRMERGSGSQDDGGGDGTGTRTNTGTLEMSLVERMGPKADAGPAPASG